MIKKLKEGLNKLSRHIDSVKKTQIKLLQIKTVMSEMKSTFDGINSRLDIAEEKINKIEHIAIEIPRKHTEK